MTEVVFHLHMAATAWMTGVIWFVQLIHYRWFHDVPTDRFPAYHAKYTRTVGYIVGPAMSIEFVTALVLLFGSSGTERYLLMIGLALLIMIWTSTGLFQVPCHAKLARGYDAGVHQKLVTTNWIRTAGWSARLVLLIGLALVF